MSRFAAFFLACIALVAAAFVAPRTLAFVLDRFGVDKRQDAQLDELELQIRDLRAALDARDAPARKPSVNPDDDAIRFIPIGRSPVIGPQDALVTIVAFLDYQCPFCNRVQPTLEQLVRENSDVRVVVKHHPLTFHRDAFDAALTAECAHQQGMFWTVHKALFDNMRELPTVVDRLSTSWSLDMQRFNACKAAPETRRLIEEEVKLAERTGATGTPGFFINGRKLMGAQPYEKFRDAIERARAEAKLSGIPAARYYTDGVLAKATVF